MHFIYKITNITNNKIYIGQSIDVKKRWNDHVHDAFRKINPEKSYNRKYAIHEAIAKYGVNNFIIEIIHELNTIEEANNMEEFYIKQYNCLSPNGYNLHPGGRNKIPSQETKDKIRAKLKIVGSFIGKKGKDHPNFGTHQSIERKQRQSLKLSGDNSSNKKINSKIAREIFLEKLTNNTSTNDLIIKYGLKRVAILNILNKKCWKDSTKDLPNIILK